VISFSFSGWGRSELNTGFSKSMLVIFLQTTLFQNIYPETHTFPKEKFPQTISEKLLGVLEREL